MANPFYLLAPRSLLVPLVVLATMAAVIASQALISGAFSLTQQAVQLGYSPRVTILHTSRSEAGQIYVPEINNILMIGCLVLVIAFGSTQAIGAAYGIAVTGTMAITSLLFAVVAHSRWNWSLGHVLPIMIAFLTIDVSLFAANVIKIWYGGWVPIAIAIGVFTLMSTWKTGRYLLTKTLNAGALPLDLFLGDVARRKPPRVPGTAVFMTSSNEAVPVVLLHHLKHNKVLHEQVILMSVVTHEVPEVPAEDRVSVEKLEQGFYRVTAGYGFMESPNVPEVLQRARDFGIKAKRNETTFYLGRERVIVADGKSAERSTAATRRDSAAHDVAMAEEALRHHVAQRALGDRVLRHSAEPRRRARGAGRVLTKRRRRTRDTSPGVVHCPPAFQLTTRRDCRTRSRVRHRPALHPPRCWRCARRRSRVEPGRRCPGRRWPSDRRSAENRSCRRP